MIPGVDAVDRAEPGGQSPLAPPVHLRPAMMGLVLLGGALGSLVRHGVARALPTADGGWPTSTLVVNLAGSFTLGLLIEGLARGGPDRGRRQQARLFAGTGFCGGLTTASTLAVEADLLARGGHGGVAAAYALASMAAGLVATALGLAAAHLGLAGALGGRRSAVRR